MRGGRAILVHVTGNETGRAAAHDVAMPAASTPRPRPCASCPYRQGVPSGVWHEEEYDKLPRYDGDMASQPAAVFMCHQGGEAGHVCSGWLGHRDPADLLAVRIGVVTGALDPSCAEYTTNVPLFTSGAEAAAHGRRDIDNPSPAAAQTIAKVTTTRARTENPVR